MALVALTIIGGLVVMFYQKPTEYMWAHFFGFVGFALSVVLINIAVIAQREKAHRLISILGLVNSALAISVYALQLDLGTLRGLNIIADEFGDATRMFIETASLLAVCSLGFVKRPIFRYVGTLVVLGYLVFLAKSLFVLFLYVLNRYADRILRGGVARRVVAVFTVTLIVLLVSLEVLVYRSDIALSVGLKLLQLQTVTDYLDRPLAGYGWGYVIDAVASKTEQPYQVEMQLPMLVVQTGLPFVLLFVGALLLAIRRTSASWRTAWMRWITFVAAGFVNPWLLLPSWYLTAVLMYDNLDHPGDEKNSTAL